MKTAEEASADFIGDAFHLLEIELPQDKRVILWGLLSDYLRAVQDSAVAEKEKEVEELKRRLKISADHYEARCKEIDQAGMDDLILHDKFASAQAALSEIYKLWQSCRPDLPFEVRAKIVFELEEKFQKALKEKP